MLAQEFNVKESAGALISEVTPRSPAETAGANTSSWTRAKRAETMAGSCPAFCGAAVRVCFVAINTHHNQARRHQLAGHPLLAG